MEFSFGIPSQRAKSAAKAVDLYPQGAALTICKNAGPRTSKTMVLNPAACEHLGIEGEGQIAFDFTKSTPVIVNATGMPLPKGQGYVVKAKKEYAGLTFKDSKLWAYFVKTYNLDETAHTNMLIGALVNSDPQAYELHFNYTVENADEEQVVLTRQQEAHDLLDSLSEPQYIQEPTTEMNTVERSFDTNGMDPESFEQA